MAEVASAFVSLMPSAKGFGSSASRQIGPQMNSVAKTTGSRFGKVFAYASMSPLKAIGAAAIGLFAVAKVKEFFSGAIDEARESQKVSALTAQVIKSTGGAAGISAKQVGSLANSISLLTGIDDEAVQGAENLLLTFTNLHNEAGKGNDVFNQATKIVTDMSVALDQDLKSSSIQVGKALNDPIKGITALSRVGVSFTEQQKDQIKTLVESGHTLKAQKIILGELNKEFGGAATAAATSGDKFKTAFANLQESVGLALLPLLDKLLDKGTVLINWMIANVPPAFAAFKAAVMPVVTVLQDFIGNHLEAFKTALSALAGSALTSVISLIGGSLVSAITILVGALASPIALVGALAGAAVYAYTHFEGFRVAVNSLAISLGQSLTPVIASVSTWVRGTLIPALIQLGSYVQTNIIPALVAFGNGLRANVLPVLVEAGRFILTQVYPAMIQFWGVVAQKLKPSLDALVSSTRADLLPALQQAAAKFKEWQPTLQQVAAVLLKVQLANDKLGASVLGKVLPPVIKLTNYMAGTQIQTLTRIGSGIAAVIGFLGKLGGAFGDAGQAASKFTAGVKQQMGEAVKFVGTIPGRVKSALGDLGNILYAAGRALIGGLISGITSRISDVTSAISGLAGQIKAHFPGSPVKTGPLTSWNNGGAGVRLMDLLKQGILSGGKGVSEATLKVASSIADTLVDKIESLRDRVKSTLESMRSDFASLRDSIASTFTGNLFESTTVGGFFQNAMATHAKLAGLISAFKKLRHWGLSAGFLSQLFQSGNTDLILALASGPRSQAQAAADLVGMTQHLGQQLGGDVARNQFGDALKATERKLDRIESNTRYLRHLAHDLGRELDHAGARAGRKR